MTDKYIEKIHFLNFKGFRNQKIEGLHKGLNILIGDNDTGKSTILLAIDLVLGGNVSRIEAIGLDRLFNQGVVDEFLNKTGRKFEDLPEMEVDLYLNDQGKYEFDGEGNIAQVSAYGLCLICRPRDDLFDLINKVISLDEPAFPYEYYSIEIKTFSGAPVSPYKKPLEYLSIDNTRISNDYAAKSYIKTVYRAHTDDREQNQLKYGYRHIKDKFSKEEFKEVNNRIGDEYQFALKSNSKANLETDLTISQKGIDIENLGVGGQCFIRTSFALSKKSNIDVVLLEEPENHLSHAKMRLLIEEIREASQSQLFIATHSSLICSRLDLRNTILFASFDRDPIKLEKLPKDTAEFFIKAPSSAVLEFVLSEKNLLVEGDAEYVLVSDLYKNVTGSDLNSDCVHVISIGGISFPRYLDIANLLGIKTAVITDNDGNIDSCRDRYQEYVKNNNIAVFYDAEVARRTFEICVYRDNKQICDDLFATGRRKLSVEEYMLKNKSQTAFELMSKRSNELKAPDYISQAIKWISD